MGTGSDGGPAYCTRCGVRRSGGHFCTQCGSRFAPDGSSSEAQLPNAVATTTPPSIARRRSRGRRAAWVVVGAAVLALGGAAAWAISSLREDSNQATSVPAATSEATLDGVTNWLAGGPAEDGPAALDVLGPGTPPPPVTGSFELGPVEQLVVATVAADGGSVTAPDGLTIEVPTGAYDDAVVFDVSKQQILGYDFPTGINPISALYTVDNGGHSAGEAMWVEVPADVPPDGFAMGFLYDRATGGVEALPLIGVGADSVVVATGHFADFFIHGIDAAAFAAIVGAEAALNAKSNEPITLADSGFRPGVDDWSFRNLGSYIAHRGHCAGQSLSAMWYFVERAKRGAPALHVAYDNDGMGATELWFDDRLGYRLASAVQSDYGDRVRTWLERAQRYFDRWRLELAAAPPAATNPDADNFDLLQFTAFVIALQVTGEPQYVSIGRLYTPQPGAGTTTSAVPEPRRAGHAMVVYGADTQGLWIADPNWSGGFRRVPWDASTSTLGPYFSGPNANEVGRRYDSINLMGKTSLVDWAGVERRFIDADTGNSGNDVFPSYALEVEEYSADGTLSWVPLTDGYTTPHETIEVRVDFSEKASWLLVHCEDGHPNGCGPPVTTHTEPITVTLAHAGDNHLEFLLAGPRDQRWEYVDFARITVHRAQAVDLTVTPPTQSVPFGEAVFLQVDVTNLGAAELQGSVYVAVPNTSSDVHCDEDLAIPGRGMHSMHCSFVPTAGPGTHRYEVGAVGVWSTQAGTFERTVFTAITIEEEQQIDPPGGFLDALDRWREQIGFESDPAREVSVASDPAEYSHWLTPDPVPLAVYTVTSHMRVHVGVYASEVEAQAAFEAIATEASSGLEASPADAHWCEWFRQTLDRYSFHGGDAFISATVHLEPDGDPNQPGAQVPGKDVAFVDDVLCQYERGHVESSYGYPIVEDPEYALRSWVQGPLVVTMRSHWSEDAAEVLHAELAAIVGG